MAATAYAAVVSLLHIIEKIQNHHAAHLKSFGESLLIEDLRIRSSFLQDFIESCNFHEEDVNAAKGLESRIADLAYAAEDILETHVVDRILAVYSSQEEEKKKMKWIKCLQEFPRLVMKKVSMRQEAGNHEENSPMDGFNQRLEKVIQDMDLIIEKDLKKRAKDKAITKDEEASTTTNVFPSSSSSTSILPSTGENATRMVGFDEYLEHVLEKLTGQGLDRQFIPIFGMGGIGKTTLAKNVYANPLVVQYFDIRAWATVSQEYSAREILLGILHEIGVSTNQLLSAKDDELGRTLYKELFGRRYLVILDDMWSVEAWDKVRQYFPNNNNGSRIMITTRISNLASQLGSSGLKIEFLDDDGSWKLFCQKVFRGEGYPKRELEEVGKMIAKKCKGLPLSIVTIAGLLAKSKKTLRYWGYVLGDLNSIITLDGNEHCLKVLALSYSHLPVHLKPCFLYMGVFPEDYEIRVSRLVKLWVAEGFLRPHKSKSLEEVAEDCLHDLIDRNLISVQDWGSRGKIRTCAVHDLLRELCMKESKDEKFLCVGDITQDTKSLRRFAVRDNSEDTIHSLASLSLIRSVTCNFTRDLPFQISKLLRVLNGLDDEYYLHNALQLFNSQYLRIYSSLKVVPSSINLLWNLQTVYIRGSTSVITLPIEIWEMAPLRHLKVYILGVLPDPPTDAGSIVLGKLQTVSTLMNFKITEETARRIPNLKKLKVECNTRDKWMVHEKNSTCSCLSNLDLLHQLESLFLSLYYCDHCKEYQQKTFAFPLSLKKLHLSGSYLPWESIATIGRLPHLEILKLWGNAFYGDKWDSEEGQFQSLKFLQICSSASPKYWNADETCFPCLENLELLDLCELVEIPSGVGEIPTLKSIYVDNRNRSVVHSAKRILEEQRSYGNDSLQVLTEEGPLSLDDE